MSLDKSRRRLNSILFRALMLFTSRHAAAQLVATKNLTNPPNTPTSPTPTPLEAKPATSLPRGTEDRDCFRGVSDGVIVPEVAEKLQLEIVKADPRLVYDGTTMVVTVRLKPVRALKGFQRVALAPAKTKTVRFELKPEAFAMWNDRNEFAAEPATVGVWISPDSAHGSEVPMDILP